MRAPSKPDSNALKGCGLEAISQAVTNGRYRCQPAPATNIWLTILGFFLSRLELDINFALGLVSAQLRSSRSGPWAHFLYLGFLPGIRQGSECENVKNSVAKVRDLIEPTVRALELDLWGIEHVSQGKYSVLRIFIESEAGITLGDCERVSRQVGAILDVEDPISGEYTLEVSSPGLERSLFTLDQFAQFVGIEISVRMRAPIDGRRKFKGVVAEVTEDSVKVQVDNKLFDLPIIEIEKANVEY